MKLSRRSPIKDLWHHPVGHELLLHVRQKNGLGSHWPESPLVANLPLAVLDRYAFPGFSLLALELCCTHPCTDHAEDKPTWWKEAILYQIFLPSFMDSDHDGLGDFAGVVQRLPYLTRLGVNTLWLSPVLAQGAEGGISNHRALHEDFGSLDDFKTLVAAIHHADMRVVLDINLSSVSPQHPWFEAVLENKGRPDYFLWKPGTPPWEASLAEKNWRYVPQKEAFCLLSNGRLALNWDNADLRREFADILSFWLSLGVDGFCLGGLTTLCQNMSFWEMESGKVLPEHDALEANHLRLQHHLRELRLALPKEDVFLLGKLSGRYVCTQTRLLAGDHTTGLNLLYSSGHLSVRNKETPPISLQHLRRYLLAFFDTCGANGHLALFWENHKLPRILSLVSGHTVYQNLLAKLLGTWLLCMHSTPVLYQGEELGLGHFEEDADFISAQAPFPWSAGVGGGFTGAVPWMPLSAANMHLHAAGQMENPRSVFTHHAKLIALRRQHPCLVYGTFKPVFTNNRKVLCFFRIHTGQKCYVEMNLSDRQIPRPGRISQKQQLLLSNYESPSRFLRPYEANVYLCEN